MAQAKAFAHFSDGSTTFCNPEFSSLKGETYCIIEWALSANFKALTALSKFSLHYDIIVNK